MFDELTTREGVPQPWEFLDVPEEQFLTDAVSREADGAWLVVQVFVDAYEDTNHEPGTWVIGEFIWVDYRSGKVIASHAGDEEPDFEGHQRTLVVERRVALI